jgi:hypothetical protein
LLIPDGLFGHRPDVWHDAVTGDASADRRVLSGSDQRHLAVVDELDLHPRREHPRFDPGPSTEDSNEAVGSARPPQAGGGGGSASCPRVSSRSRSMERNRSVSGFRLPSVSGCVARQRRGGEGRSRARPRVQ